MSGVRRGELVALRWQDVDLDGRTVRVERQYDFAARPGRFRATKTTRGVRTVPIPAQLADRLRARRAALRGAASDLIFPPANGKDVVSPEVIARRTRRAWNAAGLEPVLLYECRHTYASLAASWGVPIHALSRFLGHSTIQTTVDRYGTLYAEDVKHASEALSAGITRSSVPT